MKTRIVYIFLFICAMNLNLYSQDYHKLIDTAYIKAVYAKFDSFVESIDSLREKKECLNVYVVYYSHLKDNDIEEYKISPKYYLSGEFLEDLQELQILQRNTYKLWNGHYFVPEHILVYESETDMVYRYYSESNRLERYYYNDESFYHYIAKLYKNGQIDCAFSYPSVISKPTVYQEHYSQLMYLVFAVKNGDFYVIRDGKGETNAPAMYSLEDYINCCWNEMIGIEE